MVYRGSFTFLHNDVENHVLLLTQAPGAPLDEFFNKLTNNQIAHSDALRHINIIGKKLGNFHSYNIKDYFDHWGFLRVSGWTHGDINLHLGNVFYDQAAEKLTFIDYEGMSYERESDERRGFFRAAGTYLKKTPQYLFALIDAYLNAFPEGQIKTTIVYEVMKGASTTAGNDISGLKEKAQAATKEWENLSEHLRKDPRRKEFMGLSLQPQFEHELKNNLEGDSFEVLWNKISNRLYEIVDKNKTYWIREQSGTFDVQSHKNLTEEIKKINSTPHLPKFLPFVKTLSLKVDSGEIKEFLAFEGFFAETISEFMKKAVFTMSFDEINEHFFSIGRSIGLLNATDSELINNNEVHGLIHGELWTVDILYQSSTNTVGFIDYRQLKKANVSIDASRFFAEIARNLAAIASELNKDKISVDRSSIPIDPGYALRIEAIVYALVKGYLSSFENETFAGILKPVIRDGISVYLYNFAKANDKLKEIISIVE